MSLTRWLFLYFSITFSICYYLIMVTFRSTKYQIESYVVSLSLQRYTKHVRAWEIFIFQNKIISLCLSQISKVIVICLCVFYRVQMQAGTCHTKVIITHMNPNLLGLKLSTVYGLAIVLHMLWIYLWEQDLIRKPEKVKFSNVSHKKLKSEKEEVNIILSNWNKFVCFIFIIILWPLRSILGPFKGSRPPGWELPSELIEIMLKFTKIRSNL